MKKGAAYIAAFAVLGLALMGTGPCEEDELDDSIKPWSHYYANILQEGGVVDIYEKLTYFVYDFIDPATLGNGTVKVFRTSDNAEVPGAVEGFDYGDCETLRYASMIHIYNYGFSDFNLGATSRWLNIRRNGQDMKVYLPNDTIENWQTLALYIADDGSTYYAIDESGWMTGDNIRTHDFAYTACDGPGQGCPSLSPDVAYTPANLAAPASGSPSASPLIINGNTIDAAAGINGGVTNEVTNDIRFYFIAIEADAPYYGWEQIGNYNKFLIGYLIPPTYAASTPSELRDYPILCPSGFDFLPNNGSPCDLNPLTNYQMVIDGVAIFEGDSIEPTTINFSTAGLPAGYTPNYCLP